MIMLSLFMLLLLEMKNQLHMEPLLFLLGMLQKIV